MKQMIFAAAIAALAAGAVAEEAPDIVLGGFSVGDVKLMCRQRHGWKVDFRREADASGVEYAVVEMTREGGEDGGRIVAVGTPSEIKSYPQSVTGRYI
ncbi:MAG: hypothetical protein II863_15825 [Kiritimatiellae bacterium]|nr:hypothetical protein [Kiritimatiellia bacterium]